MASDEDPHDFLFRRHAHLSEKSHADVIRRLAIERERAEVAAAEAAERDKKKRERLNFGLAVTAAVLSIAAGVAQVWGHVAGWVRSMLGG